MHLEVAHLVGPCWEEWDLQDHQEERTVPLWALLDFLGSKLDLKFQDRYYTAPLNERINYQEFIVVHVYELMHGCVCVCVCVCVCSLCLGLQLPLNSLEITWEALE